jgi:hypothetical protein
MTYRSIEITMPDGQIFKYDADKTDGVDPRCSSLLVHAHECMAVCLAIERSLQSAAAELAASPG